MRTTRGWLSQYSPYIDHKSQEFQTTYAFKHHTTIYFGYSYSKKAVWACLLQKEI